MSHRIAPARVTKTQPRLFRVAPLCSRLAISQSYKLILYTPNQSFYYSNLIVWEDFFSWHITLAPIIGTIILELLISVNHCNLFENRMPADFIHLHDGVIKWKHFPRYWPFVRGIHRSAVNSPHKGQSCRTLIFSLICAWINGWINNRGAGDLRRHRTHYDATLMTTLSQLQWLDMGEWPL